VAEETVDLVCRKLSHVAPCTTADTTLPGAPAVRQSAVEQASKASGLPEETVAHLADLYGSRFSEVVSLVSGDAEAGQPLCGHCGDILAQVRHAVEEEMAVTVGDFLLRRSAVGLGPGQGLDAAEAVAREMGRMLGWSEAEQRSQVDAYRATAALGQRFRAAASG
jgi:glycerol-3-phosphate dehydrogenase